MQILRRAPVAAVILAFTLVQTAIAHEGPPFEIIGNQRVGPYLVAVWADPDIGIGTFFVVLEPLGEASYRAPDSVSVMVAPVSGRLPQIGYPAEPQDVRYGGRYYAEVLFDSGEVWNVRIQIASEGQIGAVETAVEATPDGTIGPIGLIVYLLPFAAVGFLWLKAYLRRRNRSRNGAETNHVPPRHAMP